MLRFFDLPGKWGIDIPKDLWQEDDEGEHLVTLSLEGRSWIRRERSEKCVVNGLRTG